MADYYMTPGGAGLVDGSSPANAFDWAGFDAWQTAPAAAGDNLYVGPGNYVGTTDVNAGTDGGVDNRINIIGVSSLDTLAEAFGNDRPLFAMNANVVEVLRR